MAKGESGWPFAVPVTDDVAPGYSKEITRPMDLGNITTSLKLGGYATLGTHACFACCCHRLDEARDIAPRRPLCHRGILTHLAADTLLRMPKRGGLSPRDYADCRMATWEACKYAFVCAMGRPYLRLLCVEARPAGMTVWCLQVPCWTT